MVVLFLSTMRGVKSHMDHWPEVLRIVDGALKLNSEQVTSYARLLSQKLHSDGNEEIASRIDAMLVGAPTSRAVRSASLKPTGQLPLDQDSRLPVADVYLPASDDSEVVLNKDADRQVERFIRYYREASRLTEANLNLPHTILLYGPPGCGKTLLARHIARALELPLFQARLDSLISSFLGSTAKNIRHLFEYARERPCVLFLDEFDAIAKVRDDVHELGELKRVVNSLLQNIDSFGPEGVLMAATNHEHMLDPAVWRRFTFAVQLELPDSESRRRLIEVFLRKVRLGARHSRALITLFSGLSGASIEVICTQALREAFLEGQAVPALKHFGEAYFSHVAPHLDTVVPLRDRAGYLMSLRIPLSDAVIAELLGCSRQFVNHLHREGGDSLVRPSEATDKDSAPQRG